MKTRQDMLNTAHGAIDEIWVLGTQETELGIETLADDLATLAASALAIRADLKRLADAKTKAVA